MRIMSSQVARVETPRPEVLFHAAASRPSTFKARPLRAFTLMEVMIASAIFFMAVFSILALVGQCLRSAHMLNRNAPTPGMAIAESGLFLTNKLEEGFNSGDFGDLYPKYEWETYATLVTNGFFQVDITVSYDGRLDSSMSIYSYKPESATGLSTQSKFRK